MKPLRSLLIGCGNSRAKKIHFVGEPDWTGELTTLDINPACGADVIFDLERLCIPMHDRSHGTRILPFDDDTFDELGAFDVLEHFGRQGDWRGFFTEMAEFHRILKPGGMFSILVPLGEDAMVDPGHTRFFHAGWFNFLNQSFYERELAAGAPVTDYRWFIGKMNFDVVFADDSTKHHLAVVLQKA